MLAFALVSSLRTAYAGVMMLDHPALTRCRDTGLTLATVTAIATRPSTRARGTVDGVHDHDHGEWKQDDYGS